MGKPEAKEWLAFASDDLESAEFLLGMSVRKLEIICYHAQQCAEKALKALIILSDTEVPRTHDLRLLSLRVAGLGFETASLVSELALLQPYSVAVRYPFGLDLESGDEMASISAARVVLGQCKRLFDDFGGQLKTNGDLPL